MKRETPVLLSLASLTWLALAPSGAAWAQAQQPQYPPAQYPPAQYPQQQYPAPRPAQPTPTPAYPPGYPAPQYPQQPGYPPGYPPRPAAPQAPAPQYPPGYPAPQYPPQAPAPGYPQQPPAQPGYPQQPGYPPQPGYPQQPGYPPQAGYPQPGYDVAAALRPGAQEHTGFYVRLLGGPNYLNTGWSLNGFKLSLSGFGAFLDAAIGGAPLENFVVYGEATMYTLLSGSGKLSQPNGTTTEADTKDNLYTIGIGPGAAYYIMPLNLYFGGSLQATFMRGDLVKETNGDKPDVGLAFNVDGGKEFFVTDDWGVGANLRLSYIRNGISSGGNTTTYNTIVVALCFSATFN